MTDLYHDTDPIYLRYQQRRISIGLSVIILTSLRLSDKPMLISIDVSVTSGIVIVLGCSNY